MKVVFLGLDSLQVLILFVTFSFLLLGFEAALLHYRARFRHWAMWAPVILCPLIFIWGLVAVFIFTSLTQITFQGLMLLSVVQGLWGTYFHIAPRFRGSRRRFLSRLIFGPPIIAPLSLAGMGVLGLLAFFLV